MEENIKVGDIVARKSHNADILFKVDSIIVRNGVSFAMLRGLDVRLFADAPLQDLIVQSPSEISKYRQGFIKKNSEIMRGIFQRRIKDREYTMTRTGFDRTVNNSKVEFFEIPGQVLHIDGDKEYLDLCLTTYSQLKIKAHGFFVPEKDQPDAVASYLPKLTPDILVVTGHDGLLKGKKDFSQLDNYRHSKYFVESVRMARKFEPGRDDLIVFAGACQSHYESIIEAGANFASSPQRILIHAFDPVFIVEKLAYTSIYDIIAIKDIINNTITGIEGVGGIETRGRLRMGYPKSPY